MANTTTIHDTKVHVGDTLKVHYQFKEGEKTKEQAFQGTLIKIRGHGVNKMVTVRKVTKDRIGVERIFPTLSPFIKKVDVVKSARVRRSKLYFVRKMADRTQRERMHSV